MNRELRALDVGDAPDAWRAAGFMVDGDDWVRIGTVRVRLVGDGGARGIRSWSFDGAPCDAAVHPNGALSIDHVVLATPDAAHAWLGLTALGLRLRRVRDVVAPDGARTRQAFFPAGEPHVEVVGPAPAAQPGGAWRFFGLALTVADLDAAATLLGDGLGRVKDAVQPGRRIATVRHRALGLSVPLALMSR